MEAIYQHGNRSIGFPSHPLNEGMIREILSGATYPLDLLQGYLPKVIVDVGANVGATLIYFHEAYPLAAIHGFEPSEENLLFLKGNLQGISAVQVHPFGLLDQEAELPFYQGLQAGVQGSFYPGVTSGKTSGTLRVCDARKTLERLGLQEICLMKIDTEGGEAAILGSLFSKGSPLQIAHLFVEYHSIEEKQSIDYFLEEAYEKREVSAFEIPCFFPDGKQGGGVQAGVTFYRLRGLF